jgi:hypothetical protein
VVADGCLDGGVQFGQESRGGPEFLLLAALRKVPELHDDVRPGEVQVGDRGPGEGLAFDRARVKVSQHADPQSHVRRTGAGRRRIEQGGHGRRWEFRRERHGESLALAQIGHRLGALVDVGDRVSVHPAAQPSKEEIGEGLVGVRHAMGHPGRVVPDERLVHTRVATT